MCLVTIKKAVTINEFPSFVPEVLPTAANRYVQIKVCALRKLSAILHSPLVVICKTKHFLRSL